MSVVCVICQNTLFIPPGEKLPPDPRCQVISTPCGHLLHMPCLQEWVKARHFKNQPSKCCPHCKRDVGQVGFFKLYPMYGQPQLRGDKSDSSRSSGGFEDTRRENIAVLNSLPDFTGLSIGPPSTGSRNSADLKSIEDFPIHGEPIPQSPVIDKRKRDLDFQQANFEMERQRKAMLDQEKATQERIGVQDWERKQQMLEQDFESKSAEFKRRQEQLNREYENEKRNYEQAYKQVVDQANRDRDELNREAERAKWEIENKKRTYETQQKSDSRRREWETAIKDYEHKQSRLKQRQDTLQQQQKHREYDLKERRNRLDKTRERVEHDIKIAYADVEKRRQAVFDHLKQKR